MSYHTPDRRQRLPRLARHQYHKPRPVIAALLRSLATTKEPALRKNLLRAIANLEARAQQ
jgi:hypothetical protein